MTTYGAEAWDALVPRSIMLLGQHGGGGWGVLKLDTPKLIKCHSIIPNTCRAALLMSWAGKMTRMQRARQPRVPSEWLGLCHTCALDGRRRILAQHDQPGMPCQASGSHIFFICCISDPISCDPSSSLDLAGVRRAQLARQQQRARGASSAKKTQRGQTTRSCTRSCRRSSTSSRRRGTTTQLRLGRRQGEARLRQERTPT